jgi:MbtH protein
MTEDATSSWKVLVNGEEQYAIFPDLLPTPGGWSEVGFTGNEAECMAYVDTHWTDMRPRSLREAMQGTA